MRPQETMNREKLIIKLKKKGLVVRGTSEEFDGTEGGIWISAEEEMNQWHFDYYAESNRFQLGVSEEINKLLEDKGWFAEWYDPGTIFIYEI
tara:strand:+ start:48 stop:323 length:276 start_codon:yes stop_codon:yes gene_type:complete